MKTTVDLQYEDKKIGEISYDEDTKRIVISGDHPVLKKAKKFMEKKRKFQIPVSQELDDYRIDTAFPNENITYFELTLCTLCAETGVFVNWKTQR